jgi:hypothetical protein
MSISPFHIFYCQTNTDNGSDTSYKLTRSSPCKLILVMKIADILLYLFLKLVQINLHLVVVILKKIMKVVKTKYDIN